MKKSGLKYIILGMSLLFITDVFAQVWTAGDNVTLQISSFALIETNHAPVTLTMATSTAGAAVGAVSNSDLFVKASSITPGGTHREIMAKITSGTIPAGTKLTLISAPCTTGGGARGTPIATAIILSAIDQLIVDNIGTCYTGTGYNDGYRMTFTWSPLNLTTNYSQIAAATYNITVVFTLSASNGN